jgi:outer membrane protein with beta-barrel domain
MKYGALVLAVALCLCAPSALFAQSSVGGDHVEVGVFADYFNLSRTSPHINFVGLGARAGFNVNPHVQIEAEMAYDFDRNFTSVFSDGITTQLVQTRLRTLHAMFGPKFQTSRGPFRAFATFKAGFVNFSTSDQNAPAGFVGALGSVTSGNTRPAIYPGVGVEGFWGPLGLRADVGDQIYFDSGARNNMKVTFGPVLRF